MCLILLVFLWEGILPSAFYYKFMIALVRISSRDTGKTMVDASLGEIMTTCEKITWLISEGERWLKPEYRYLLCYLLIYLIPNECIKTQIDRSFFNCTTGELQGELLVLLLLLFVMINIVMIFSNCFVL